VQVSYAYDVFGNRLAEDAWTAATGEAITRFAYDGWNPALAAPVGNEGFNVLAHLDSNSSLTSRYLYGDVVDQVFAAEAANSSVAAWYLTDRQGSVRAVTEKSKLEKGAQPAPRSLGKGDKM
jgi:hypothetical protein